MLRSCTRYAKVKSSDKSATGDERLARLEELFRDYASVGLTTVSDRNASAGSLADYQQLLADGKLPVRMMASHAVDAAAELESVQEKIRAVARHPLRARQL